MIEHLVLIRKYLSAQGLSSLGREPHYDPHLFSSGGYIPAMVRLMVSRIGRRSPP